MSKPFAAKGVGACLKHVLNTRFAPASLRQWSRPDVGGFIRPSMRVAVDTRHTMLLTNVMVSESGANCVAEGDPLPPTDRLANVPDPALDGLYRSQRPRLLRFLASRTTNDNVQDVTQQSFLRLAALDAERRTAISDLGAYLRCIALNLVRDEAKLADRRSTKLHCAEDSVELHGPDEIAGLEARDMLRRMESVMARLKPSTREIFMAHRIDGYTYSEISARTGLSLKRVEKHMSKAIAQLDRLRRS